MREIDPRLDGNSQVDKRRRRQWLPCAFCPPNRGENRRRVPRWGAQKKRKRWSR